MSQCLIYKGMKFKMSLKFQIRRIGIGRSKKMIRFCRERRGNLKEMMNGGKWTLISGFLKKKTVSFATWTKTYGNGSVRFWRKEFFLPTEGQLRDSNITFISYGTKMKINWQHLLFNHNPRKVKNID